MGQLVKELQEAEAKLEEFLRKVEQEDDDQQRRAAEDIRAVTG